MNLSRLSPSAAAKRFASSRADYYRYLARIIEATKGRKSLRRIFLDDAARYGNRPRGVLSAHWADRFDESGDLVHTFSGTLPSTDVAVIGALQRSGGGALELGLHDLASITTLIGRLRQSMRSVAGVGLVALLLLVGVLAAIPLFTVPELRNAFADVPAELYRANTRTLFGFADWLANYWLPVAGVLVGLVACVGWSFQNLTGPLRAQLDRVAVWRLYRYAVAIQFLATLATLLRRRGNVSTRLREGILMLRPGASPYLANHLDSMLERVDDSRIGAETFKTGLLDADTQYFLEDMIDSSGLDDGLQQTRTQLESHTIHVVLKQAQILRWSLLLGAVAALLGIFFWHQIVMRELISLLKLLA